MFISLAGGALFLAACGGGSGSGGDGGRDSTGVDAEAGRRLNNAPVISGAPSSRITVGGVYNFQPQASDAEGDPLQFGISGRPSWASFNRSNGRLSGIPTAGDVGRYTGIVIFVSDGDAARSLPAFSITVSDGSVQTGAISLAWHAPTQRTDGESLSLAEISGYRIYYGTGSGKYQYFINVPDGQTTSYVINELPLGAYYFAVTAYDMNGLESGYSNEVVKTAR